MGSIFIWGIQVLLELLLLIQITNLNVRIKKDIIAIDIALLLFNAIVILNINSMYKINILLHIIDLLAIFLLYKENAKKSVIGFSIGYFVVMLFNFLQVQNFFIHIVEDIFSVQISKSEYSTIDLCFFIVLIIISRMLYKNIKRYIHIINRSLISTMSIIIASFFMEVMVLNELNRDIYTASIVDKIMILNLFLFIAGIAYTTIKFTNKFDSMQELNNALEVKNGELRKIKHDYGAQISYLYGLYLLKRWDDLEKSLKDICIKNSEVSNVVSIRNDENSIFYKALKPALKEGVHIIVEESIESNCIAIGGEDLFHIVSVIRENALKYVENDGIIIVRVYGAFGNAVIEIENSCTHRKSTKLSNMIKLFYFNCIDGWEDIYKLNEIKKIIEDNNGDIYVKNKNISTLVNITIPLAVNN